MTTKFSLADMAGVPKDEVQISPEASKKLDAEKTNHRRPKQKRPAAEQPAEESASASEESVEKPATEKPEPAASHVQLVGEVINKMAASNKTITQANKLANSWEKVFAKTVLTLVASVLFVLHSSVSTIFGLIGWSYVAAISYEWGTYPDRFVVACAAMAAVNAIWIIGKHLSEEIQN